MQCPVCEKFVEDNSKHCPHCGTAVERTFCSECGQPIGGEKNKSGGIILIFIFIIGIMLVLFNNQRAPAMVPAKDDLNVPQQTPVRTVEQPYEVVSSNSVSFEDLMTVETKITLPDSAGDNLYVESLKAVINEQKLQNPMNIVVVYAYEESTYAENPLNYKVKATYVNTDLNADFDTALLEGQQSLPGHIYLKWRD